MIWVVVEQRNYGTVVVARTRKLSVAERLCKLAPHTAWIVSEEGWRALRELEAAEERQS